MNSFHYPVGIMLTLLSFECLSTNNLTHKKEERDSSEDITLLGDRNRDRQSDRLTDRLIKREGKRKFAFS